MTEVENNVPNVKSSNNSCKNCGNPSILKCPTCVKLNLEPSYYCSQVYFYL